MTNASPVSTATVPWLRRLLGEPLRPRTFAVLAAGGAISAAWVAYANAALVFRQAQAFDWLAALPAVGLTLASVSLRFVRWQYLLRRCGVVLPARRSAGIFVAGLAMLLTPAYAGEGVKTLLLGRTGARGFWRAAGIVVIERLFDVVALALIAGASLLAAGETPAAAWLLLAVAGAALSVGALAAPAWAAIGRTQYAPTGATRMPEWGVSEGPPGGRSPLRHGARAVAVATTLTLSVLAWTAGCLTLLVVAAGAGVTLPVERALGTYALATLLGGVTLLPAGVGVVGTTILLRLQVYGASTQQAVLVAVLVRVFTVWLTAGIGVAACWRLWRRAGTWLGSETGHFDALGAAYAAQLSESTRRRVVARKVALMRRALTGAGIAPGTRLLDAGCGQGWYVAELRRCGYEVVGIDAAFGQLAAAAADPAGAGAPLAAASVTALPFSAGGFDAAYAVNVFHHIDAAHRRAALGELARAVRPGGLVFVHEINTVNPLYRFYMSYLFPLWKRIDLGTEEWLDPRSLPHVPWLEAIGIEYFTFLPDFIPSPVYGFLAAVERRLERSRWARFSAHFTAVYRLSTDRDPALAGDSAAGPAGSAGPPVPRTRLLPA